MMINISQSEYISVEMSLCSWDSLNSYCQETPPHISKAPSPFLYSLNYQEDFV